MLAGPTGTATEQPPFLLSSSPFLFPIDESLGEMKDMSQETKKYPQCGGTKLGRMESTSLQMEKTDSVTFVENAGIGSQYVNTSQPTKKLENY